MNLNKQHTQWFDGTRHDLLHQATNLLALCCAEPPERATDTVQGGCVSQGAWQKLRLMMEGKYTGSADRQSVGWATRQAKLRDVASRLHKIGALPFSKHHRHCISKHALHLPRNSTTR